MTETIQIWQAIGFYAAGQAITITLAWLWARESFRRGYAASERRFERQHTLHTSSFISRSANSRRRE